MKVLILFCLVLRFPLLAEDDPYGVKAAGDAAKKKVYETKGETGHFRETNAKTEKALRAAFEKADAALIEANAKLAEAEKGLIEPEAQALKMGEQLKIATEQIAATEKAKATEGLPESVKTSLKEELQKLQKAREKTESSLKEANKQMASAKEALEKAKSAQSEVDKNRKTNSKNLEDFYNRRAKDEAQFAKTDAAAEKARLDGEKAQQGAVDTLKAEIKGMTLGQRLADLKSQIKDAKMQEHALEEVLNDAASGKFIRMKLEGLLKDPMLCEAAKSCADENARKNFKPDLKRLFTSTARERNEADSH